MTDQKPSVNGKKSPPKKNKGGRPRKFSPKHIASELIAYFDRVPYTDGVQEVASNKTVLSLKVKVACEFPTIAGFCVQYGMSRQHLWTLANERDESTEQLVNPELSDALKRGKDHQEHILVVNTLFGLYEKTFAIFAAKNLIEWRDTQHLDHTSKGESINKRVDSETGKLVQRILTAKENADKAKPSQAGGNG